MSDVDREHRIVHERGDWCAQLRFLAEDSALRERGILPGWHTFKRSKRRAAVERAEAKAKALLDDGVLALIDGRNRDV